MGREVRIVPADWQHPKDKRGHYIPLFDGSKLASRTATWDAEKAAWDLGFESDWSPGVANRYKEKESGRPKEYTEWDAERPDPSDYMPAWPEQFRTHLMMYENTTEGTPISPACETAEELARWLADNNASAFGRDGASYEAWLRVCRGGFAPSIVIQGGVINSGVEAFKEIST